MLHSCSFVALGLEPLLVLVTLLWSSLDHIEYLGSFGESGGVESLLDVFGGHLVGLAKEVEPRFDRIGDHLIIARYCVLWQLKKMNLQAISQFQVTAPTAQTEIAVNLRRLVEHDCVKYADADGRPQERVIVAFTYLSDVH